jgi:hypothetical protein
MYPCLSGSKEQAANLQEHPSPNLMEDRKWLMNRRAVAQ